MKNKIEVILRRYPVILQDADGRAHGDYITLEKGQVQAAQVCGLDDKALIRRLANRQGFRVLDIHKPQRLTIALDLEQLARRYAEYQEDRAKWDFLYGEGMAIEQT